MQEETKEYPYEQKFNLEHQYQLFLERMALSEDNMHPQQKVQLKQTFYGACGQMLVLFRDDIGSIKDEQEAVNTLKDMFNQVGQFFINETNQQN